MLDYRFSALAEHRGRVDVRVAEEFSRAACVEHIPISANLLVNGQNVFFGRCCNASAVGVFFRGIVLLMASRTLGSAAYGIGDAVRALLEEVGGMLVLLASSLVWLVRPPFRYREFVRQLDFVGAQSALLIALTGAFTGMVSALQGYNALHRYGAESLIGATVVLALARELGPVIGALMVIARVGSSMTTELGAMRSTQQIDALSSMAVEPIQYLVVPRIFAATVCVPILALVFSFAGMVGAYLVAVHYLNIDPGAFMAGVRDYLVAGDITHGMIKALVFGVMLSVVACHQGFYMTGGARGAGMATTKAVVLSSVLVLVLDYVMTSLMFRGT